MILFTSDLDRTLIYSNTMMEKYPVAGKAMPIEFKENRAISYMSEHSIEQLKEVCEQHIFIPVTTRAIYQYERINLFQNEIKPKYAITSNGGTILVDGKIDVEWDKLIRNKIAISAIPPEDLLHIFSAIRHEQWVLKEFYIDDLFYMFHVDQTKMPRDEFEAFKEALWEVGWRLFLQGRKLYLLPIHLEKSIAVNHLEDQFDFDFDKHIAAGDSLMDYEMLLQADIGYSPLHGELYEHYGYDQRVTWLSRSGANSTEDLFAHILQLNQGVIR